ncbi:M23 family metallopeptidase [Allosphingosinicella indica]|uniref:Peptidase family M23 n=1 Tax=Allosphingosinicella indica TaxID=941907 RepID=A0A1X7FZ95_9SPHN|nr:M23 family metallopeptidase [Allosphingosinicella indica]SMF60723.1 Peptidase family M23 [Allosphingosinicella indica]
MKGFGTFLTIVVTAVVTCLFTSLFWIAAYSSGSKGEAEQAASGDPPPPKAQPDAPRTVAVAPSGLALPVAGVRPDQLVDTYNQARAGGDRSHDAIDIMAPAGTPVVAAAPGTVEKLFFSEGGGGITAYVRSNDRNWIYYYAHLQSYAPGLAEGQRIARGAPVGLVGSTGNASPEGPHLHFAIHRTAPAASWHEGEAINPYPLLAGKAPAR